MANARPKPAPRKPRAIHRAETWVDRLLALPGRGDFTNDEIDRLFARDPWDGPQRGSKNERTWQLQEAKNRFSELVRRTRANEAQVITVRGEEVAALIPIGEYREHHPQEPPGETLFDALRSLPLLGDAFSDDEIDSLFPRDPDTGRNVEFE